MISTVCRDSTRVFGSKEQSRVPGLAALEKLTSSSPSLIGSEHREEWPSEECVLDLTAILFPCSGEPDTSTDERSESTKLPVGIMLSMRRRKSREHLLIFGSQDRKSGEVSEEREEAELGAFCHNNTDFGTLSGLRYSEYVMACLETPNVHMESSLKHGNCSNLHGGIFRDSSGKPRTLS